MPLIAASVDDAVAAIPDGAMVIVPREACGAPMEATRALIRRGVKRLHLVALQVVPNVQSEPSAHWNDVGKTSYLCIGQAFVSHPSLRQPSQCRIGIAHPSRRMRSTVSGTPSESHSSKGPSANP